MWKDIEVDATGTVVGEGEKDSKWCLDVKVPKTKDPTTILVTIGEKVFKVKDGQEKRLQGTGAKVKIEDQAIGPVKVSYKWCD